MFFLLHAVPEALEGPYTDLFLYAKSLHTAGAFEQAEVEYKRYIFMQNYTQEQGEYLGESFCALAELSEQKGDFELAAQYIQNAILTLKQNNAEESQIEELQSKHIQYLSKASNNSDQFLSDNLYIFSYMNLPDFSDKIKFEAYSTAISDAVSNGRIEYAQKTFTTALELFPQAWDEQQQQIILSGFEQLAQFKPKKLKLAGYLSFFPGLGQLYAHDYKDSLNAFLLNGSLIAVSVWSLCMQDYLTFSLLEFNTLVRFMQGNIYNAQKDAHQYNLKKQRELSAPILNEILYLKNSENAL